jgi:P27 family predicted phage terminase small subunit
MARPCKSAKVLTESSQTKSETNERIDQEEKLKGKGDIMPPDYLSQRQLELFCFIVNNLEEAGLLGALDTFILTTCVIAIDRLEEVEKKINLKPSLMANKDIMKIKETYTKDFLRCCNELSLSPQSRAKLANINMIAQQNAEDPLLQLLNGGDTT